MNEQKYHNGEPIIKSRMEYEDWYNDFSTLLEWGMGQLDSKRIVQLFQKDYKEIFGKKYQNEEQLYRWAECSVEANKETKKEFPDCGW